MVAISLSSVIIQHMKRLLYNKLLAWKHARERVPLVLRGARQVGKSFLLEEFAVNEFDDWYCFDFEKDAKALIPVFDNDLDPRKIIDNLSLFLGRRIDTHNSLVIFDEIQNCPRALTSLKYFYEDLPELAIACAGSLLGISLSEESFPVGKVTFLDIFPMNFEEFLMNCGEDLLYDVFNNAIAAGTIPLVAHNRLWELLKDYYVIGGMPRIVRHYLQDGKDKVERLLAARSMQRELLDTYFRDFSKHSGKVNAIHIGTVFENLPKQLSGYHDGSVKRYRFKDVLPGKKSFAELEGPITWLIRAGLVIRVNLCHRAELPLMSFCKSNLFKLYVCDIGLLGSMLELAPKTLLLQDYGMTKGFFAENYVACELVAGGERNLYSWTRRNSEIEFLKDFDGTVIPMEVKSGTRTKSQSLRQYMLKYSPAHALKLSGKTLNLTGTIKDIPLYLAGKISELTQT